MITFKELPLNAPATSRLTAYCTASSYLLKALFEACKTNYKANWYRDSLSIELESSGAKEVFCFAYGVTVFWGFEESEELAFLQELKAFENEPLESVERESMNFSFGPTAKIQEEEVIVPDTHDLSHLALSCGLAQSVKLSIFEYAIQKTINKTKSIPIQLATRGKITLSKSEIRKKMGELFIERSSINLHSDILDTPEFFWDHSELEPLYRMIATHLDLKTRVEILNQRLDTVHDLFEMLGNEVNHQHSSKLEWIIIWLIVIEVTLTLLKDVFSVV